MGRIQGWRVIVLIVLFVLTGLFIHGRSATRTAYVRTNLRQAVSHVQGWHPGVFVTIDPEIVSGLDVDDYVNQSYRSGPRRISLFIGYYETAKKVGATHSPLVCFPGQGWAVSDTQEKTLRLAQASLHLSSMVVSKGRRKELVLYWFQAYDMTSPGTFLQKVYLLFTKVVKNREENAFVRVTVPMNGQSMEEAFHTGELFIRSFYPGFLKFVKERKT